MVDKKSKTKAAMMQELESIKGLLLEDDEIPILQEVIENKARAAAQSPMTRRDIDELHSQFEALSQTISGKTPNNSSTPQKRDPSPQTSPNLLDAFTRSPQPEQPKAAPQKLQQPSLFQEEDTQFNTRNAISTPSNLVRSNTDNDNHQRPSLAKANGENPFLPQHIRARLHGNNPPPMFDFAPSTQSSHTSYKAGPTYETLGKEMPGKDTWTKETWSKAASDKPKSEGSLANSDSYPSNPLRQQLIKEVVAAMLPLVEVELRHKLEDLSQRELEQLLDQQ